MWKHMLTQTGSHPRSGNNPRTPATATVVGIPSMDELQASPVLDRSSRGVSRSMTANGDAIGSGRPVSVHGNIIQNQSLYANTAHLATTTVAATPNGASRSMNANLNLSSGNESPLGANQTKTTSLMDSSSHSHHELNTTQISPINGRISSPRPYNNNLLANGDVPGRNNHRQIVNSHNVTPREQNKRLNTSALLPANVSRFMSQSKEAGVKEMITSLGLLCLVSLLLAVLSLALLLKISPETAKIVRANSSSWSEDELRTLYEVTLAMCACALSLNLCCLLVCAIQFLFAVKLVRARQGRVRTSKYLKEASFTRVCAIGGLFVSIPVFLTGIILYSFLHADDNPTVAIITAALIGLGIVFSGAAVVHNVFVWQREKVKALRGSNSYACTQMVEKNEQKRLNKSGKSSNMVASGLPQATLDLSGGANATIVSNSKMLELSTLV